MVRVLLAAALGAALCAAGSATAQTIGDASFVRKDVRGVLSGRLVPVNVGDSVYRDQIIRTAADSSAVLVFLDKSSMAVGPQSEVRLDEFVFKGGARTVDTVKGFFRFISGPGGDGHNYNVRTPHATIAVRGTTFDVRVTAAGTAVVLHAGAVDVCSAGECRSLTPGHWVETRDRGRGMGDIRATRPGDWTYADAAREHRAAVDASAAAMDRLAAAGRVRSDTARAVPPPAEAAPPAPQVAQAQPPAPPPVLQPPALQPPVQASGPVRPAMPEAAPAAAPQPVQVAAAPTAPPLAPPAVAPASPAAAAPVAPLVVDRAPPLARTAGTAREAQDAGRLAAAARESLAMQAAPWRTAPDTPADGVGASDEAVLRQGWLDFGDPPRQPAVPYRLNQAVIASNKNEFTDIA